MFLREHRLTKSIYLAQAPGYKGTVTRFESRNRCVYEMYASAPGGGEFKALEVTSTRVEG